jgi:hypothetical protein
MKGEKIVQTRKAVNSVLAGLQPEDRLSLTTFSYLAEDLYSPPGPPDLDRARSMVEGLQAGGGTNMVDGLRLGMQKLQELSRPGSVKRILLLGDGDANLGSGDMTRIAAWARDHDAAVSSFGVGEGFDAKTMEEIARASGGNFYSIQDEQKLHEVFGRELDQMRRTAGDQAQLVIKPSFGLGVVEVLGRPSWLEAGPGVISLPSLTAGTHQTVEVRLRRHSRTPVPGTRGRIDVHLDFLDESLGDARQVHGHTEFLWTQEVTP